MIKHKIHEIAKDLDMQSKDLMTMLEGKVNMSKKHNTVLEDDMLNFVFEKLTKDNEAADLSEYLEPKKAKPAEPKKEVKAAPKQEAKPAPKKEAKPEPQKEAKKEAKPEPKQQQAEPKKELQSDRQRDTGGQSARSRAY